MSITSQLQSLLDKKIEIDGEEIEISQALLKVLMTKAINGDTKAINLIFERVAGKANQPIELSSNINAIEFDSARALQTVNERLERLVGNGENPVCEESVKD